MLATENVERRKPDIDVVRATIEFAKETGRLQPSEQDMVRAEEEKEDERRQLRYPLLSFANTASLRHATIIYTGLDNRREKQWNNRQFMNGFNQWFHRKPKELHRIKG